MEGLAAQLLGEDVKFQSFTDQVAALLRAGGKKGDQEYAGRIQFKATPAFLNELEEYGRQISNRKVRAKDLAFGKHTVPGEWIAGRFQACGPMPFAQQLNEVTEAVVDFMRTRHEVVITGKQRTTLRTQLKKVMGNTDLPALYENFFVWLNRPDLFHRASGRQYEYADVFPLIFLKLQLEGATPHHHIKHLVIDEMQDYTPVQYRVLARLFPCKKTILGDYHQSVSPLSSSSAEAIRKTLPEAQCMFMNKSYRSTVEITVAKGLEFDRVIVPQCTADNYRTDIDRHMLYVACTRAMHRLHLTHTGPRSPFLATSLPAE